MFTHNGQNKKELILNLHYDQVLFLLQINNLDLALIAIDEIIQYDRNNVFTLSTKAEILENKEKWHQLEDIYRQLMIIDFDNYEKWDEKLSIINNKFN